MITADPAAASPIEGTETLGQALMAGSRRPSRPREADEDDTAVILYTSGTTGQPKGAELMHRNMLLQRAGRRRPLRRRRRDARHLLCVLPLFHSFGQTVIQNAGFAFGGTVVMLPRFEAGPALELMAARGRHLLRRRPDDVLGPARRARRLRRRRRSSSPTTSGSPRPAARRCRSRCTRSSSRTLRRHHPRGLRPLRDLAGRELLAVRRGAARVGSIGTPIPGVEMKLINDPDERDDDRGRPGRGRRDRDQGPQHHEGLLQPPRRHRRGDPRRLVPLRRPRPQATRTAGTTSSTAPRT